MPRHTPRNTPRLKSVPLQRTKQGYKPDDVLNLKQAYVPDAPRLIQKGSSFTTLLNRAAVDCLIHNLTLVYPAFDGIKPLGLLARGQHLAKALRAVLPESFEDAAAVLIRSLTPPLERTKGNGLAVFFYLPHVCFIAAYGLDEKNNGGRDPFEISMTAQYEMTRRFSAEFSIRPFLIRWQERTINRLMAWTRDQDPYVRRSVANHLGDIAKDHPEIVYQICGRWLKNAPDNRKWLIRHALRHPAKQGAQKAIRLKFRARIT